ncbi:hypothetical protein ABPG74_019471 [Tetrahymena malaccensis]
MQKKVQNQTNFESDDTEGSDLSYESSFDEKEDNQGINKEQKNINLFKEQMVRFLLTHPELQDDIKFSKDIINAQAETPVAQVKNDQMGGGYSSTGYNTMYNARPQTAMVMGNTNDANLNSDKKTYRNNMWETIANNIMQESKKTGTMPSIENFSQRLNLFRKKIEKPDVIEIILQNKDTLLKQIKKEEERKAKIQNRIHETIEAKLRKEQGDVKYYSKLKKNQFDSRMQKEEARVRQINNNQNQTQNQNNPSTNNINSITNFNPNTNQANAFQSDKSPEKRNSVAYIQQSSLSANQQGQLQQQGDNQERKLKQQRSFLLNQNNPQTSSVTKLIQLQNPNVSQNQNNVSVMGMQNAQINQQNQKNQKNIRFQTPPNQYSPSPNQRDVENRGSKLKNPILQNNNTYKKNVQQEYQKQFKTFKARPVPGVFERLSQDTVKKNQQTEVEIDMPLDIEFKTAKGEMLYREIRKKDDEEEVKRYVIKFLLEHRQKAEEEFKQKPSLLSQGQKYYSEESKEFSLLSPNFMAKKKMQEMIEKGTLTDDFFEQRANLEEGNAYLLTKVSKILKGNIMKKWKSLQDSKF